MNLHTSMAILRQFLTKSPEEIRDWFGELSVADQVKVLDMRDRIKEALGRED